MSNSPFPRILGTPTKLDFVLPKLCCNCGLRDSTHLKEVSLYANRFGIRVAPYPAFTMDLPLCEECNDSKVPRPVTLNGVKRRFLSGRVTQVSVYCRSHAFAESLKSLNQPLVAAGWLQVIDGGNGNA